MKIKQLRAIVARLLPVEYGTVFDGAYTAKEIRLVADAAKVGIKEINKREMEFFHREAQLIADIKLLTHKVQVVEEHLARAQDQMTQISPVRLPAVPQEEVFLVPAPYVPPVAGSMTNVPNLPLNLRNKITLIKAVREVSSMGLKEAKDLVEDVEKGNERSVFKGPTDKVAVADRILKAAGGHTVRKEAF